MERVCGVCGGQKRELFSSTYCPRCEGDERKPEPDWLAAHDAFDEIQRRVTLSLFVKTGSVMRCASRDVVAQTFVRMTNIGTGMVNEYIDVFLLGKGAPQSVVDYWVAVMGGQ